MTVAEIAELPGDVRSRPSPWSSTRICLCYLCSPGAARAVESLRAPSPRRAHPHRRQEARADPSVAPVTASAGSRSASASHRRSRRSRIRSAASSSTSASTTRPGSPTSRCSPTRRRRPRSASCAARSRFYRRHGIAVERVITVNSSSYRSTVHSIACRALYILHLLTLPYHSLHQHQILALHPPSRGPGSRSSSRRRGC